jgi:hypothetical protein
VARSVRVARSVGVRYPPLPSLLHALVPAAVLTGWALLLRDVRLRDMNDLGLVSVLPHATILLLFVLAVSFSISLARRPLRPFVPLVHVVTLIVMLYGITAFLEQVARFGTVYTHVGIIDYIIGRGSVNPNIDAYFNWPGFFALGALITKAAGFRSALAFAAWGPLLYNLLAIAPLVMIFRWASDDRRITWLGLWVFYSTNWIGQDYISPQATAYVLWLTILAALLTWFTPRPAALARTPSLRRVGRLLDPHRVLLLAPRRVLALAPLRMRLLALRVRLRVRRLVDAALSSDKQRGDARGSAVQRVGVVLLIVVLYGAIVTGHQLTPVPALLTVIGLVLFARTETRGLPVIMVVLLAAWLSFMTTGYLAGNLSTIAGAVGSVSKNVGTGVAGRLGGSVQHEFIVNIRLLATGAIWLLAAIGLLRRARAGRLESALVVVGIAPLFLPVFQSYGGEVFLRVYLFALPAVAFFIAALAFPSASAGRTWPSVAAIAVVGCGLLGLFQFTRYGNERLDAFTKGDAATVQAFYRIAPRNSTVYAGTFNLPWRYRDYSAYNYHLITDLDAWTSSARPNPVSLVTQLRDALGSTGGYVIITRSTKIKAALLDGKPYALGAVARILRSLPTVRDLYRNQDGDLFYVEPKPSR